MIKIKTLTEQDIGSWVVYTDGMKQQELGKLKSWNDTFIFVVYSCDNQWYRFKDFTGASTRPEDLHYLGQLDCEIIERMIELQGTREAWKTFQELKKERKI